MDEIKEAFSRVREDINFLFEELSSLKEDFSKVKSSMDEFNFTLSKLNSDLIQQTNQQTNRQTNRQTEIPLNNTSSISKETPTHNSSFKTTPTHNPTHNLAIKALNPQILGISTGNDGVPTDKQTNQQTNQQTQNSSYNPDNPTKNPFEDAIEALDSLDNLKKELRIKFKRLTEQEMAVFGTLYQLSEEYGSSDYKSLSIKLNLSESSIRDYIGRIIAKGIPVDKTKINNKNIQLSVPKSLKKVASLQTLMQLREI